MTATEIRTVEGPGLEFGNPLYINEGRDKKAQVTQWCILVLCFRNGVYGKGKTLKEARKVARKGGGQLQGAQYFLAHPETTFDGLFFSYPAVGGFAPMEI